MGTFVTGNTPLPARKVDARPPIIPEQEIDAADVNGLWDAADDLRTHASGWINVKEYGAKGDGIADDTAALNAALAAAVNGKRVRVPAGTYLYSSQLLLKNGKAVELIGEGARASILRYNGAVGGTAFKLLNSYRTVLRGIRFDRVTNDPAIMVEIQEDKNQGDYDSTAPSQLSRIEECTVKNGGVGVAIDLPAGAVAGDDIMNDTHLFDHNIMDGQTVANVQMTGANALRIGFRHNYFTGAPSAVQVLTSPAGGAPGFYWHGGYVASTTVNFDLQNTSTDGYQITSVRSEGSPRLLRVVGGTTSAPIIVDGVYYSSAALNADGFAILVTGGGPFHIRGCSWVGTAQPKFSFSLGNGADVIVEGNSFETTNSVAAVIVNGSGFRAHLIGNRYKDAAGTTRVTKNDTLPAFTQGFTSLTYVSGSATSMGSIDLTTSALFKVTVTDGLQFGFDNPTGAIAGTPFHIQIKNGTAGALSAATPWQGTNFRAGAYTAPATGKNRTYTFFYDGAFFYEIRSDMDVGN